MYFKYITFLLELIIKLILIKTYWQWKQLETMQDINPLTIKNKDKSRKNVSGLNNWIIVNNMRFIYVSMYLIVILNLGYALNDVKAPVLVRTSKKNV